MKSKLDLASWPRKDHFHFFKAFDEPFFGICVDVDCTPTYEEAKRKGESFFLHYLFKSLDAANAIPEFKYRINKEEVYIYDQVDASPTINRPDGTFGFSYIKYAPDFSIFKETAQEEIARVQSSKGLDPAVSGENVIHYSSVPWIKFKSISHARNFKYEDSCPKIAFGKMTRTKDKLYMPVSIHVHHALMDGIHVSRFLEEFQTRLTTREAF